MRALLPPEEAGRLLGAGQSRLYSDTAFRLMPLVIGLPQFVLNVFVVLSVVLVTVNRGRGRSSMGVGERGRVGTSGRGRREEGEGEGSSRPVVNAAISR